MAETHNIENAKISNSKTENIKSSDGTTNRKPSPMNIAFNKKIAAIDARIAATRSKLDDLRAGSSGIGLSEERRAAREKVLANIKSTKESLRTEIDAKKKFMEQIGALRDEIEKKTGQDKATKEKLPFRSIADMEARVRQLEASVESGALSVMDEKKALGEVSKLKRARKAFEEADSSNDINSLKLRKDRIRVEVAAHDDRITEIKKSLDIYSKELDTFTSERASSEALRAAHSKLIEKTKSELDAAYEEKRVAFEENRKAKEAAQANWLRKEAQRAEYDRRREIEERLDAALEKLNAFSTESKAELHVTQCSNLVAYLVSTYPNALGKSSNLETSPEENLEKNLRKVTLSEDLTDAIDINKSKNASEDIFYYGSAPTKHKKGNQKKKIALSSAEGGILDKMPLHIIASLADLGLKIPASTSDLPDLVDAINEKKAAFASKMDDEASNLARKRAVLETNVEAIRKELEASASKPKPAVSTDSTVVESQ